MGRETTSNAILKISPLLVTLPLDMFTHLQFQVYLREKDESEVYKISWTGTDGGMLTLPIFQVDRKKKSRMLKEKHMNLKGGREGGRRENYDSLPRMMAFHQMMLHHEYPRRSGGRGDFLWDQNKMGLNRLGRKILTKNDDIPSDDFSPWVSKYSLSRVRLSLIACMLSIPKKTIYWEQQKQFNVSQIPNNKIVKKNKADLRGSN